MTWFNIRVSKTIHTEFICCDCSFTVEVLALTASGAMLKLRPSFRDFHFEVL